MQDAETCSLVLSTYIVFYAITSRFSTVKFPAERSSSRVQRASSMCLRFNALNEPLARPIPPAVCAHILARGRVRSSPLVADDSYVADGRRRVRLFPYTSFLRLVSGRPSLSFLRTNKSAKCASPLKIHPVKHPMKFMTVFVVIRLLQASNLNRIKLLRRRN